MQVRKFFFIRGRLMEPFFFDCWLILTNKVQWTQDET